MTLSALTEAAEARRTAETEYRSAVLAAWREHGTMAVAGELGISPQAVRQLVKRARETVARVDDTYAAAVQDAANGYTPKTAQAITAYRNGQARKRKARGLPPLETVKSEALRHAESQILAALREGLAVDGLTAQDVDEAQALRQAIGGGLSDDDGIPF